MNELRFADEMIYEAAGVSPAGFLLLPAPAGYNDQTSAMQRFYQQMYDQAVQANQASRLPDLFANMN